MFRHMVSVSFKFRKLSKAQKLVKLSANGKCFRLFPLINDSKKEVLLFKGKKPVQTIEENICKREAIRSLIKQMTKLMLAKF